LSTRSPAVTDYTYYQNSQSNNSQLLQSDGTYTYAWDNNGNLETKGATNYTWDYDDRLVGISSPTVNAFYVYDHLGDRVRTHKILDIRSKYGTIKKPEVET